MKKINRWLIFFCCVCRQLPLLSKIVCCKKYRSMALDYNHDLKAADKNIAAKYRIGESGTEGSTP